MLLKKFRYRQVKENQTIFHILIGILECKFHKGKDSLYFIPHLMQYLAHKTAIFIFGMTKNLALSNCDMKGQTRNRQKGRGKKECLFVFKI